MPPSLPSLLLLLLLLLTLLPTPHASSSSPSPLDSFKVHGYRWHSLSLLRDLRRLEALASQEGVSQKSLEKAADYVAKFNQGTLVDIEETMFFPWIDERCSPTAEEKASLLSLRASKRSISSKSLSLPALSKSPSPSPALRSLCADLAEETRKVLVAQDTLVVPIVVRDVSEKEQTKFNNLVLRKLGLLNSRVHLVGMRDAVWESGSSLERRLFEADIPRVARSMIPRWRAGLYKERVGELEGIVVDVRDAVGEEG